MTPRWRLVLFLAVLLGVLFTQSGRRDFPLQTRKLKDGSTLKLVSVTYGTRHRHLEGSLIERWLILVLPSFHRRLTDDRYGEIETATDLPVAWILYTPPPPGGAAGPSLTLEYWTLFDEHGCEVPMGPRSWPTGFSFMPARRLLIPAPLTPLTHRCNRLGIRFWATRVNAPATPEAEFEVLSQEAVQTEVPAAEALPATREFHGLRITLASLENSVDSYSDSPLYKKLPMRSPSEKWVHAFVHVDGATKAPAEWEPKGVRLVDSSGLILDPRPFDNVRRKPEGTVMSFFGSLWNHEPAYDVEVEMGKTAAATFAKDEPRTVVLPVPSRNSSPAGFNNPIGFDFKGKRVEVSDPYWGRIGPPQLVIPFSLRPQPQPGSRIVLINVTDNEGRPVPRSEDLDRDDYVHFPQKGVEMTHARLSVRITKPARTIKVTFALAEPEWVRFHVKPTQWTPPK